MHRLPLWNRSFVSSPKARPRKTAAAAAAPEKNKNKRPLKKVEYLEHIRESVACIQPEE